MSKVANFIHDTTKSPNVRFIAISISVKYDVFEVSLRFVFEKFRRHVVWCSDTLYYPLNMFESKEDYTVLAKSRVESSTLAIPKSPNLT